MYFDKIAQDWNASWIWHPATCWKVNDHCFARRIFTINSKVNRAKIRISAYTDYVLYINGTFVGRGPVPCDPWYQSFDTYDVGPFLREGKNVIAVLGHNHGLGLHWQPRGQGGLIAQLDIETAAGIMTLSTDDVWQTKSAECFSDHSPRQFWSMGFAETFDFRKYDDRWLTAGDDSTGWTAPEVFGPHPARPWTNLVPREIPKLYESFEPAVGAEQGIFTLNNVHAVRFDNILPSGRAGIVYAQAEFVCNEPCKVSLHLECDDALKLFLNGRFIFEKNYSEDFARTRVWRGKDDYEQVHYGTGAPGQFADIALNKGTNKLLVALDHGTQGWGFVLALLDPQTRRPLPIPCKSNWTLAGPTETTGFNDSLDSVKSDIDDVATPKILYSPFDYENITDYATLMLYEERSSCRTLSDINRLTLNAGEFGIIDLGKVRTGFPKLEIVPPDDAILDIGYTHSLRNDRGIRYYVNGMLKYVDRIYAKSGTQTWQPLHRRTGRYLHISCRKGTSVRLQNPGIVTIGYPVRDVGTFECADPGLNRIWTTGLYTQKLLMQYGYQDCLKREQGTLNTSSFNYMTRIAAASFGDYDLAKRGLATAARTQNDSGWFDSHGLSSPNCDEFTECLWWAVWLKEFYLYSGDTDFMKPLFDVLEDNLRYFAKSVNRSGLLVTANFHLSRPGQIIYVDDALSLCPFTRGSSDAEVAGLNILYYAALTAAADLAGWLNLADRLAFYTKKAARVKDEINRRFWNPQTNLYADWRKEEMFSDTAHPVTQITALYFDLCDETQTKHLLKYLCDDLGLPDDNKPDYPLYTFGYYFYFLELLFRHGREDLAYKLLHTYYGRWLDLGATAFGEFFRLSDVQGKTKLTDEYEVHGYGTSAQLHFYTNLLGIRPLTPGFTQILFKPCPGNLVRAKGSIHTPLGIVAVEWRIDEDIFTMNIDLPKTCEFKIEPPKQFLHAPVIVNGDPYTNER